LASIGASISLVSVPQRGEGEEENGMTVG